MTTNPGLSELTSLVELIHGSLTTIQSTSKPFPSLNEPGFNMASEAFRKENPETAQACKVMAAAALQLAAAVMSPVESLFMVAAGGSNAAALRVCLEANVSEILREAGPDGLHVNEIGKKAGVDASILARLLRVLATTHIYKEVKPDVFTNNRISGLLDTGKSHKDIIASPKDKHDGTMGIVAIAEHLLDENFKQTSYLWESLSSPNSEGGENYAFNHAFNTKKTVWEWYEQPENAHRLKRFGIGMRAASLFQQGDALILGASDWAGLPPDSVIVDVGSGTGAMSMALAAAHPHLKVVLQDREATLKDAQKLWNEKAPQALSSGQATLQPHDFFNAQPVQSPAAFFLKSIIHDWDDDKSLTILRQLRKAAGTDTKLIIIETIVPHACHVPTSEKGNEGYIEGSDFPEAPAPLLANGGLPNTLMTYMGDTMMLAASGGQERTLYQFKDLFEQAGWGLKEVRRTTPDARMHPLVAIPI